MWDSRRVFLAVVCFSALFYRITAGVGKLLETAVDVIDDIYSGCREQALQRLNNSQLLIQEMDRNVDFRTVWLSHHQCTVPKSEGKTEQINAVSAYLNGADLFSPTFDKEVETMGVNVSTYEDHFHFKALHFLLMDAISMQKPQQCQTVFVLQQDDEPKLPPKGATVRFGSFTRGYSDLPYLKKQADFDDRVVLNITSCFFVDLGENECDKEKYLVLLSPAEEFTVEEVNMRADTDTEYREVVLKHLQLNSTHNCFTFSRSPAAVSTWWPAFVPVIFSSLYLPG